VGQATAQLSAGASVRRRSDGECGEGKRPWSGAGSRAWKTILYELAWRGGKASGVTPRQPASSGRGAERGRGDGSRWRERADGRACIGPTRMESSSWSCSSLSADPT